jgi:methyltransferase (TIGR00027 family)
MSLPNLSYMMNVGQLRYIQAHFETADYYNPDAMVGKFLTMRQRLSCLVRGKLFMQRLRANPWYHYVLARTRYYDEVFLEAIRCRVKCIINIGCGSDTRAYRFADMLGEHGISVMECDQPQAIRAKQNIASRYWPTDHVRYVPLDLNDGAWPEFSPLLDKLRHDPVLVMMEGVSPYIRNESFKAFLALLSARLGTRSVLSYDFKIAGAKKDFGRTDRVREPFRLPGDQNEVGVFHSTLGFRLQHFEFSADLTRRLLPAASPAFDEDCLLRLALAERGPA